MLTYLYNLFSNLLALETEILLQVMGMVWIWQL